MSTLVFTNPGIIDPVAMMTFGVSAKGDNATAIGMFGTGLKYAVAVLLRNGFKVDIHAGETWHRFTKELGNVRGKDFDFVYMDGKPMHFTTELGKFWEPWMALRELASNAMDEGGSYFVNPSYPIINEEETTVVVHGGIGSDINELYSALANVFLKSKPIFQGELADIHPGQSTWVYYRGIRAMRLEKPSMYTYNILKSCTLTEDRTLKWAWDAQNAVTSTVNDITDKTLMTRIISAPQDTWERSLAYSCTPTDIMTEVVGELVAAMMYVPATLKELCHVSTIETLSSKKPLVLDALDKQRLDKAIGFAKRIGYEVDRFPIIATEHLGDNVLGMAIDRKIYISSRVFHMGTKMLVGTLIEEFLHLSEGCDDCTRTMQNILIDRICSLGERLLGEAL